MENKSVIDAMEKCCNRKEKKVKKYLENKLWVVEQWKKCAIYINLIENMFNYISKKRCDKCYKRRLKGKNASNFK